MFTKAAAEAYFNGEKQESLLFILLGAGALIAAALLFFYIKHQWAKGAAWPLLVTGLLQIAVGYTVYSRSDAQRKDIVYKMDMNPLALQQEEVPRMEKVMRQFVWYRYTEITLLIAGVALFLYSSSRPDKAFWMGVGAALTLQAALMLMADGFAEKRGAQYLQGLKDFVTRV